MMTHVQTQTYRKMLLALRSHLRGDINLLVDTAYELANDRSPPRPREICRTCRPSWRTRLTGVVGLLVHELVRRKEETLEQIDDALDRLDAGTFGYCQECADAMPDAWLTAAPYAPRCPSCESRRLTHP